MIDSDQQRKMILNFFPFRLFFIIHPVLIVRTSRISPAWGFKNGFYFHTPSDGSLNQTETKFQSLLIWSFRFK